VNAVAAQKAPAALGESSTPQRAARRDVLTLRPEEIRRSVEEKARPLLIDRLRSALWVCLALYGLFVVHDLIFARDRLGPLLAVKAMQIGVVGAVLLALRQERIARHALALALSVTAFMAFAATVSAIVRENTSSHALLFVVLTIGTATVLPWGVRAQGAMVAICGLLLGWDFHALGGSLLASIANPAVGAVLTAAVVSLYIARVDERYRWQIEERELSLERSQAALSAVFESTTDAVWSVDKECRLVTMNAAFRELSSRSNAVGVHAGQTFDERIPPEVAPIWRELYDRVLSGERVTTEQSFERRGRRWHLLISMCPIREGGEITGATVFSRDITEMRHTEEIARRNQAELTHVLRLGTMGEIASTLAHEINQPLGAISNYASAVARWIAAGAISPADVKRGLEQISAEALRAGEIIRRLRELSRKADGHMEVLDLNGVIRRAAELMAAEARVQGISIGLQTEEALPPVYADGIQVEQVILNLILNGIEAMQSSPIKRLSLRTFCGEGCVEVAVRDSGVGLDRGLAEHVFDPFFTTKPMGLGMGLAISRRIVEAHGGQLYGAPNRDGRGSTFSFRLPRHEKKPQADHSVGSAPA